MQASPIKSALNTVRILIVDDDQLNRSLLEAIFEAEGCRVTLADGGAAGLDAFAAEPIDIVLLDLRMPGLNGIETLRRMREVTAKVPILILTSQQDVAAAVDATDLGADDFITRPIENEELVVRVALTLKHRRMADELESLRSKVDVSAFIRGLIERSEPDVEFERVILPMPLRTLRSTLVARIERMAISQAMRLASGNKAAAARLLSVDVKTLYSKLRRYDLARRPNSGSVKQRPIGN
jgi:DNA-binding NtrC family response regulator